MSLHAQEAGILNKPRPPTITSGANGFFPEMASLLDAEQSGFGYFYTNEFVEVGYWLERLLAEGHCLRAVFHSSAIFEQNEERKELHLHPLTPINLDPNQLPIDELLEDVFNKITAPESFENIEGSGWTIVPGTFCFWCCALAFRPNNPADDNARNTESPPAPLGDDSMVHDSFLLCLARFHVKHAVQRPRSFRENQEWLRNNALDNSRISINPSNLPALHAVWGRFNLRVFSEHGNVIYDRKFEPDDKPVINLLWKYRKFRLIRTLTGLFKEHAGRVLCNVCKAFHRTQDACKQKVTVAKQVDLEVPEVPYGRHGCVVYADFESIVTRGGDHYPSGFGYVIVDKDGEIMAEESNNVNKCEINIISQFFVDLCSDLDEYITADDTPTTECCICGEDMMGLEGLVGKNFMYGTVGSHHKECWGDPKNQAIVYFHNFKGYDSHYIIKYGLTNCDISSVMGKSFEKFDVIAMDNYPDNHMIRICFKDTFNFLGTSLAKLVKMVEDWRYTPIAQRNAKGLFPYKWFDDYAKFDATSLPPPEDWYNEMTNSLIDPTEAYKEWEQNKFKTFEEYHDHYMKLDVILLCDVFEEFRRTCVSAFKIDPVHFQGAPGYTWQLGVMAAEHRFKIIQNVDVYTDIQNSIRGGVSQCMTRYVNVRDKPDECMLFLDVNSLYSKCMTYKLPTLYLSKYDSLPDDWQEKWCDLEGDLCALICVDLEYPEELHDKHVAYPLAPHKYNGRLCTTFRPKLKYLVLSHVLKFYLDNGLIMTNFHYAYEFEQDYVLRDYVNNNIDKRRATKSAAMKTLYKLLNNSIYGKTCENAFKYKKYSIFDKDLPDKPGKCNRELYKARNFMPLEEKILAECYVTEVNLSKPIQVGFGVLDFAKYVMYKFLLAIIRVFGDNVNPIYTDTDSLLLHFKVAHPEAEMMKDPELVAMLDFEKVPDGFQAHTPNTDKVSGLWSLEADGKEIVEYVGLRAKTYCYQFRDNGVVLKNKGVTAAAMEMRTQTKLMMSHYYDVLFRDQDVYVEQYLIKSKKHDVSTVKQKKLALSSMDEKRIVCTDKITTVPFGYKGNKYKDIVFAH